MVYLKDIIKTCFKSIEVNPSKKMLGKTGLRPASPRRQSLELCGRKHSDDGLPSAEDRYGFFCRLASKLFDVVPRFGCIDCDHRSAQFLLFFGLNFHAVIAPPTTNHAANAAGNEHQRGQGKWSASQKPRVIYQALENQKPDLYQ